MKSKLSTISETYYDCERCGKPIPSTAVCNCTDKKYSEAELQQEIAEARLASTYRMMTDYVDWCNDHSTELDDGAGNFTTIKPTFLGFRRFLSDKVSELSQTLKEHKEKL